MDKIKVRLGSEIFYVDVELKQIVNV